MLETYDEKMGVQYDGSDCVSPLVRKSLIRLWYVINGKQRSCKNVFCGLINVTYNRSRDTSRIIIEINFTVFVMVVEN